VVGVIVVVSLDLIPGALVGLPGIAVAAIAFLIIILLKVDVALVAVGAMISGIGYAILRALF
jgi:hypothetical protein